MYDVIINTRNTINSQEIIMPHIIEINDFNAPELNIYTKYSEKQLRHIYEPDNGLFIAESPKVIERALDFGCIPVSLLLEKKHIDGQAKEIIKKCGDIPIYTSTFDILTKLTGFELTRGALCAMYRPKLPDIETVCKNAKRIAILENVMNPTNIGAIFRCAAALNMDAILLTLACSDPLYRRCLRVSMGTVFLIPWGYIGEDEHWWQSHGPAYLNSLGFKTAAMALTDNSVSIDDKTLQSEERLAIILGSEGYGLSQKTIDGCDYTVKILTVSIRSMSVRRRLSHSES